MMVTDLEMGRDGEFGNQLFQLAAVYGYARKHNAEPVFAGWVCERSHQDFNKIFGSKLSIKPGNEFKSFRHYQEPSFRYNEIPAFDCDVNLHGYFQSEKYFSNCADEVRQLLSIPQNVSGIINERYGHYFSSNETVGFHMRFAMRPGMDCTELHGSLTDSYYLNCIDYIGRDKFYIVCSDNAGMAKSFFEKYCADVKYIISNDHQLVDFFLLQKSNHIVIANSSYSWWAAYLNENNGIKLSPPKDKWFTKAYFDKGIDTSDILPDIWTKIDFKLAENIRLNENTQTLRTEKINPTIWRS